MGAKWQTTIGYENRFLQFRLEDRRRGRLHPLPDLRHAARSGPLLPLQRHQPPRPRIMLRPAAPGGMGPRPLLRQLALPGHDVLDVRNYSAFSGQHIPGSWHLDLNGNFPTFAGWVLPTDRDFLLVADSYDDAVKANVWARRVGVDRIVACLDGGIAGWAVEGRGTARINLISARELHDRVIGAADTVLLDVRSPSEYADEHIGGAINIPAPDLRQRARELDRDKPVYIICSTGNRSSLAASILAQNGFRSIANVAGGMTGYSAAGYARHCAVCINPHGPRLEENGSFVEK